MLDFPFWGQSSRFLKQSIIVRNNFKQFFLMIRITTFESVSLLGLFFSHYHEHAPFVGINQSSNLSYTYKASTDFCMMSSNYILYPILREVYLFSCRKKTAFLSYRYKVPKIIPYMSKGATYNSTSSTNLEAITNLALHYLATCNFTLSLTQPRGYGLG